MGIKMPEWTDFLYKEHDNMREFTLSSQEARNNVDLREYKELIQETVKEEIPDAEVIVKERNYFVNPSPTKGQAIRIGKKLSKCKNLGEYCTYVPKLFNGREIDNPMEINRRKGGRYHGSKKIY